MLTIKQYDKIKARYLQYLAFLLTVLQERLTCRIVAPKNQELQQKYLLLEQKKGMAISMTIVRPYMLEITTS